MGLVCGFVEGFLGRDVTLPILFAEKFGFAWGEMGGA